jgi:hypothetical protein
LHFCPGQPGPQSPYLHLPCIWDYKHASLCAALRTEILYEVQEQVKLMYGERIQNRGYHGVGRKRAEGSCWDTRNVLMLIWVVTQLCTWHLYIALYIN